MLGRDGIKENRVELLMQLPVSLLFGVFIDFTMSILTFWHPDVYYQQLLSCVIGCVIMAIGISLEVVADVCMNSGEYVLHIASKKLHKEFGMMKILFDVTLLLIAIGSSWIFAGRIDGVREGTVIVAVLTGPVVRLILPHLGWIRRWQTADGGVAEKENDTEIKVGHCVITIAREYGSGGHEIGELVAEKLGVPFYDNSMMEMVATESGFSEQTVRDYDQKLPHSLIFEMITQEYPIAPVYGLSKKDALFVAQSRVIRRLAATGPCVIVGRCSDYVLRDNPSCLHIFLHASADYKAGRAVKYYNIPEDMAASKVAQINAARRDHYTYYTGKIWGDPHNYHAVFDTSRLSVDAIVQAIVNLANCSNGQSE